MITFVPLMWKYITLLILVLLIIRCSEDEDRGRKAEVGRQKAEVGRQKEEVGGQKENGTRYTVHGVRRALKIPKKKPEPWTVHREPRTVDTALLRKLRQQDSQGVEIDLREPLSRGYFLSSIDNPEFSSMILLSHERSIRINFDNDIFDNTDRYYTNGIRFDFISPYLRQSPLSYLMVPYWGSGSNYYGVSIGQNMYTPYTTKVGGIHAGDRPYAAYLFIGGFKISNDPAKRFRQTSEIDLGVIGPSSFGDFVQKSFHNSVPTNNEPLGWEYQIQDDLVLNYNIAYEKGILSSRRFDLNLNAAGALGTLYTNMEGGFQFRAGWINPYFGSHGYSRTLVSKAKGYSKFQFFVFVTSSGKLVGYDATLEGGFFNKSSIYTLKGSEINRFTYRGTLGLTLSYGGVRLDIEQFLLSPEFHGCAWHKWVHIGVTIGM